MITKDYTHPPIDQSPFFQEENMLFGELIVLKKTLNSLRRTFWNNATLAQRFGQESAREVIRNKEYYPIGACLPLTMIAADYFFQKKGLHTNILVDEIYDANNHRTRKHFILQIPTDKNNLTKNPHLAYDQQDFIIDFSNLTNIHFYRGTYQNIQGNITAHIHTITTPLDPTKNFKQNFAHLFPSFNNELETEIHHLQSINTPELHASILAQYAKQPQFTIHYH